jgi:DNA end-binding protein Ku
MAPRAIWKGTISIGLVSVPVKLYSAVRAKDVRFNELHAEDGQRIKHVRICSADGEEVPYDEIVKGYEIAPDTYVVIEADELAAAAPPATRTITIDRFVPTDEIDARLYEKSYYLGPDKGGAKTFDLLVQALGDDGRTGIGKIVLRTKEYLAAVRSLGDGLVLSTMHFADELVAPRSLEDFPEPVELKERELSIAMQLVESLAAPFEHDKYRDTYREQVLDLIDRKARGETIELVETEEPEPTDDLMAALEASLAAAKQAAGDKKPAAKRTKAGPREASKPRKRVASGKDAAA